MMGREGQQGFTIVELLVALLIFGMLSAAGVALLSFSVGAQDAATERLDELSDIRRTAGILTSDLAQAAPRLSRDQSGAVQPAFVGNTGGDGSVALTLVRRGWENVDDAARPSLQKVEYRLRDGRLERRGWRFVDGASAMEPVALLEGVSSIQLRYRDRDGNWRERWDPQRVTEMPRAVELLINMPRYGSIRQLFLVGAGER